MSDLIRSSRSNERIYAYQPTTRRGRRLPALRVWIVQVLADGTVAIRTKPNRPGRLVPATSILGLWDELTPAQRAGDPLPELRDVAAEALTPENRDAMGEGQRAAVSVVDRQAYRGTGRAISLANRHEAMILRRVDEAGLAWNYEPKVFDLGCSSAQPDLHLVDDDCYIELTVASGRYLRAKHAKLARFAERHPEVRLFLLDADQQMLLDSCDPTPTELRAWLLANAIPITNAAREMTP